MNGRRPVLGRLRPAVVLLVVGVVAALVAADSGVAGSSARESGAAGGTRPAMAVVASPARVELAGSASRTVRVTNTGAGAVVVEVARAGFALDLHGRPRVVRQRGPAASAWLAARPRRLALPPGGSAPLTVSSTLPRGVAAGDHTALVLLTTRPRSGAALHVRLRLGVVVSVRAPGPIVHRLVVRGVRLVRGRLGTTVEVALANRGNVTEAVDGRRLTVVLRSGGRVLARLRPVARELLPRTPGLAEARYRGRPRGLVTAVVELAPVGEGTPTRRRFRTRLG